MLKSGTFQPLPGYSVSYGAHHVQWLAAQFARLCAGMDRFVCLTDMEVPGVETIPLEDNLPGWWSKLELFRVLPRAAYVDLDTVIVGDPSRYLFNNPGRFMVSTGIGIREHGAINTSVMSWDKSYRWIYDEFRTRREMVMKTYVTRSMWGDQGFLRTVARGRLSFQRFQYRHAGSILNYKRDLLAPRTGAKLPADSGQIRLPAEWQKQPRIVLFNGTGKPWEFQEPWIPPLEAPCAT